MGRVRQRKWRAAATVVTAAVALVLGAAFSPSAHADDVVVPPPVVVEPVPVDPVAPATPPAAVTVAPVPPSSPAGSPATPDAASETVSPVIPAVVSPTLPVVNPSPTVDAAPTPPSSAAPQPAAPADTPAAPAGREAPPSPDAPPSPAEKDDTSGNTAGSNSSDITSSTDSKSSSTGPQTWVWNWSWNCDEATPAALPEAASGSTIWIWNWQWSCAGSPGPVPAVPTLCVQCNLAVSIRVASPGDDGDVTQSNLLTSSASVSNTAGIAQTVDESNGSFFPLAPPAPPMPFVLAPTLAPPPIPPPPVVVAPPPPPTVSTGAPTRALAAVAPRSLSPPGDTVAASRQRASGSVFVSTHRSVISRSGGGRNRTVVHVEAHAFTRILVQHVESNRSSHPTTRKQTLGATGRSTRPQPHAPSAPYSPSGPAAGTAGAAAHDGGSSLLTAALVGAFVLLGFALLSIIVPASLPARRRLSDDRRARPG